MRSGQTELSVYTEKGGQFSEVIVDHHSGKVAKTATATLNGSQPVAEITLIKGTEFKTVTEPLS
jgi:hypothetical protein